LNFCHKPTHTQQQKLIVISAKGKLQKNMSKAPMLGLQGEPKERMGKHKK